jgi:hypothetical protein
VDDELVAIGGPCGRFELFLCGIEPAVEDVFPDRAVEKEGFLTHDRYPGEGIRG